MRLDFIGVGFGRTGSKWLAHCIYEHPEISIPKFNLLTEINYFPEEYEIMGINNYVKKFYKCDFNKVVGEISTLIIFHKRSAKILKKHFPNTKIIIYRRKEKDRAQSEYNIKRYADLLPVKMNLVDQKSLIAPFIKYFGKDKVHIMNMDNPNKQYELNKLFEFLGVRKFTPSVINKRFGSSYSFDKKGNKIIRKVKYSLLRKSVNYIKPKVRKYKKLFYILKRNLHFDYFFQIFNHKLRDRKVQDYKLTTQGF